MPKVLLKSTGSVVDVSNEELQIWRDSKIIHMKVLDDTEAKKVELPDVLVEKIAEQPAKDTNGSKKIDKTDKNSVSNLD